VTDGLRVAFVAPCFWPEVRRGAERVVRDLTQDLIERGHSPRLITSHPGRPERAIEDGLPVTRVWRPPDGRLVRRGYEYYSTHVPLSYRELARGDDQIAHSVFCTDAMAALRWSERTGRPWVFHYMGIPAREGLISRRRRLELTQRAVRGASAVVALSRTAQDAFWRVLGTESEVISPGVDLDLFSPGPGRTEQPTIFCPAAADSPRKRVPMLVEAFRFVKREHPKARLVLPEPSDGDGSLQQAYREAWVTALPSWGEAFGLVLAESLACGTPVVGTNREAIPEVIDRDGIGVLFDGDERDLARALLEAIELARDSGTAAACRARAEELSSERSTDAFVSLYRSLLSQ
jgi:glycosyltransferase involved in cell wall biosynthesis